MSSNNEDLARLKEHLEPPWDEVKEQRVLARVMAERRAPAPQVRTWPRVAIPAVAAVAIAAAIALFVVRRGALPEQAPQASTSAVPAAGEHVMALADGSQAVLVREAGIQVEEQRADKVKIVQRRGTVRYEVRPDPNREFSVRAGSSTVRVRGTVFTVDMSDDSVEVAVQRGRVEVDDGGRTRELSEGESLRVPARSTNELPRDLDATAPVESSEPVEPALRRPAGSTALTVGELQAKADRARLSGDLATAASALEQLASAHPRDARVPNALFSLGRVERDRGRQSAAARAFERCVKAAPSGALAQDALAEAAVSWSLAGSAKAARADASSYLARYPNGSHAQRMKAILEQ